MASGLTSFHVAFPPLGSCRLVSLDPDNLGLISLLPVFRTNATVARHLPDPGDDWEGVRQRPALAPIRTEGTKTENASGRNSERPFQGWEHLEASGCPGMP